MRIVVACLALVVQVRANQLDHYSDLGITALAKLGQSPAVYFGSRLRTLGLATDCPLPRPSSWLVIHGSPARYSSFIPLSVFPIFPRTVVAHQKGFGRLDKSAGRPEKDSSRSKKRSRPGDEKVIDEDCWQQAFSSLISNNDSQRTLTKMASEGFGQFGRGAIFADFVKQTAAPSALEGVNQGGISIVYRPLYSFESDEAGGALVPVVDQIKTYNPEKAFVFLLKYGGMTGGGIVEPDIPPKDFAVEDLDARKKNWQNAYSALIDDEASQQTLEKTAWEGFQKLGVGAIYADSDNPIAEGRRAAINITYRPLNSFDLSDEGALASVVEQIKTYDPKKEFIFLLTHGGITGGGKVEPISKFDKLIASVLSGARKSPQNDDDQKGGGWGFVFVALEPRGNCVELFIPCVFVLCSILLLMAGTWKLRSMRPLAEVLRGSILHNV